MIKMIQRGVCFCSNPIDGNLLMAKIQLFRYIMVKNCDYHITSPCDDIKTYINISPKIFGSFYKINCISVFYKTNPVIIASYNQMNNKNQIFNQSCMKRLMII